MVLPVQDIINKLKAYRSTSYPILTTYLSTHHSDHPILLKNFRHLIVDYLTEDEQEAVKKNISYIQGFLQTFPTPQLCRTLVLFSGGDHLWEVITTELEIPEQIRISHQPHLQPLVSTLLTNEDYLILLADQKRAVFLRMNKGEIEATKEIHEASERDLANIRHTGRNMNIRSGKIENQEIDHLHKHLIRIGKEADAFLGKRDIASVLVGGHKSLLHPIESNLPKQIQDKILGEFIIDLNTPLPEIIKRSHEEITYAFATPA